MMLRKRLMATLFVSALVMAPISASANDLVFDPSQYSVEELNEIRAWINDYLLPEDPNAVTIYDANDMYFEYRGIEADSNKLIIYCENNSDEDLNFEIENFRVNRAAIGLANHFDQDVVADSIYLTSVYNILILDLEDFAAYGITTMDTMDFDLVIKHGEERDTTEVHLELGGIPIPEED